MYPMDRRKLANHVYSLFSSLRKTAIVLNVSHTTISRWIICLERKKYKPRMGHKTNTIVQALHAIVKATPFYTPSQIAETIKNTLGICVSRQLVQSVLKKTRYSRKKAKFFGNPRNLQEKTEIFVAARDALLAKKTPMFSLDEVSFGRNGVIQYGYSKKGVPLCVAKKEPRMTTRTVIALASQEGFVHTKEVFGSVNTDVFIEFLSELRLPKGSVILLDNVAFHHSKWVHAFADLGGYSLLFTPPYSPWFNPIEGMFSVVKRHFYKGNSIVESFATMTATKAQAFFRKSFSESKTKIDLKN